MKIIYFILIFLSIESYAQEKSLAKRKSILLPFYITSAASDDNDPYLIAPQFGINIKKNFLYLGPTFQNGNFTGGLFSYQVFPNNIRNTFELFFQFDLVYQVTESYVSIYSYPYHHDNDATEYKTCTFLGYGFRLNLGQYLFMQSNFSLGYYWSTRKYAAGSKTDNHVGLELGIGLGFKFN